MIKKYIIVVFAVLVSATQANGALIVVDRNKTDGPKTIQEGINSALPGDIVAIADGLYIESLVLKNGVSIQGRGRGLTRIEDKGDKPIIYGQGVKDVSLSGLSISSGRDKKFPLILLTSSKVSISNTLLYGSPLSAVEAKKGSEIEIKGSIIKGNSGSGLLSSGSKISIENSFIGSNGYFGIEIKEKGEASIKNNQINENQTGGVLIREGGKAILENNLIIGNIFNGIWVKDAECQASNNTIAGNTKAGVLLEPAAKGMVSYNILYENGRGIEGEAPQNKKDKRVVAAENNLFWGNIENYSGVDKGTGDIVANPLFTQDYNLGQTSPALKGTRRIGAIPAPLLFNKLEEPSAPLPEHDENLYQTCYETGISYKNKGEYEKAIAEFNRSAELKGDFPLPYYQMGKIYERIGKLNMAREVYGRAVSIEPGNSDFHLALGEIYWRLKEYSLAHEEIKKALDINSKNEKGKFFLEKIETELGKNSDNQEPK